MATEITKITETWATKITKTTKSETVTRFSRSVFVSQPWLDLRDLCDLSGGKLRVLRGQILGLLSGGRRLFGELAAGVTESMRFSVNGGHWLPLAGVVALCCLLPATASGQERKGFWASADIGIASAGASVGGDGLDRATTGALDIGLGWALSRRMLVGMAIGSGVSLRWTTPSATRNTLLAADVAGTLTFYPRPASGLFVRGGAGGAFLSVEAEPSDPIVVAAANGMAWTMGAGYDRYLGRGFSLTPAVDFWYGRPGRILVEGQQLVDHWSHNSVKVTIGIRFN